MCIYIYIYTYTSVYIYMYIHTLYTYTYTHAVYMLLGTDIFLHIKSVTDNKGMFRSP